jgi:hypothetical protein
MPLSEEGERIPPVNRSWTNLMVSSDVEAMPPAENNDV